MYDKIAAEVNEIMGYDDSEAILAEAVEGYLRYGETTYLEWEDCKLIAELLEKYL